jgi:hypothetical protein
MKILRSILAVVAGFVFVVITHTGTDAILEAAGIFTPLDKGFPQSWMLAVALAYRAVFIAIGSYITARMSPVRPMLHSWVLGALGTLAAIAGVFVAVSMKLPGMWYPVALVIVTLPCVWVGGKLGSRKSEK